MFMSLQIHVCCPTSHSSSFVSKQNVLIVFSAAPLIPAITRSSTTRSWHTVEPTVTSLHSVFASLQGPAWRPPTPKWKAPFCRHHRTVLPLYLNAVPPLWMAAVKPHRPNGPMVFTFCARLARRILRRRKVGFPQLRADSLSALPKKAAHSFHPPLFRRRLKHRLLKVYPNARLPRTVTS